MPLTVWKRERFDRVLGVICPREACDHPVELRDPVVTSIEDGAVAIIQCPECKHHFDVDLEEIGGFLWR
jgi:hypothetical protein